MRKLHKKNDPKPPSQPRTGQLWYDEASQTMRRWNGKDWTTEVKPGEVAKNVD